MPVRSQLIRQAALPMALIGVLCSSPVHAGLRYPQVPVNGSGLQQLLDTHGGGINVSSDQVDAELLTAQSSRNALTAIWCETIRMDGSSVGIYDGHAVVPTLMPVFPPSATAGWLAIVTFRVSPTRVVVSVFDTLATLVGVTTYMGGDRNAVGFYVSNARGTFYCQDARNPGGSAQMLYFAGTGIYSEDWWLAVEDHSLLGDSDASYDDVVWLVESGSEDPLPTPVQRSSWGRLKARFR